MIRLTLILLLLLSACATANDARLESLNASASPVQRAIFVQYNDLFA
jgi:hypothetical protein